ncbi:DUF397 domain-containing protein [Amycolatopsis sp. cg5]|uniref:DUF397 domain-containing protein n=1 Tax=Amycolatopsis sp. cg5 TaxID=3238802 RepID=UPI003525C49C
MKDRPVDDKAHIRDELDLSEARWVRAAPEDVPGDGYFEYAFVEHTDGITYTALRESAKPNGPVLIYTPSEWDAFVKGVVDGEFD